MILELQAPRLDSRGEGLASGSPPGFRKSVCLASPHPILPSFRNSLSPSLTHHSHVTRLRVRGLTCSLIHHLSPKRLASCHPLFWAPEIQTCSRLGSRPQGVPQPRGGQSKDHPLPAEKVTETLHFDAHLTFLVSRGACVAPGRWDT